MNKQKISVPDAPLSRPHKKIRLDRSDRCIRGFTYVLVSLFSLCCLMPFWLIIASSFASEASIRRTGFTLWPTDFSTYAYGLLFRNPGQMIGAYVVTIGLTATGTLIGLFIISMTGYALQRRDFPHSALALPGNSLGEAGNHGDDQQRPQHHAHQPAQPEAAE